MKPFVKPLLCIIALTSSALCRAQSPLPAKAIDVKVLIDSLDHALFRNYIFPDKSVIMIKELRDQLKRGAYKKITDPRQLAGRIEGHIQEVHHDGHLRMHYDPGFPTQSPPPGRPGFDSAAWRNERRENFGFKRVEILNGNIGYVLFSGFSGFIEEAKLTITSSFRFLANTDAIIIDLRNNGGGSPWMVKQIASYFVTERTRLNDIYERRRDKTMEFWAEPELADNLKLSMPVYILTGRETFSAAEDFTYAMQVNKRAVIVGDTTGGGAHPTGPVSLGQGFVIDIPFARSINHITKTDWEGTGVLPNVRTMSDQALAKAQLIILNEKLATAKGDWSKRQIQWAINTLSVHGYENVSTTVFKEYAGTYDRFKVSVKENRLYLHDFSGRTFLLQPISGSLFQASDWLQVEFLTGSKMKFLGKPGWEDIYSRD